MKLSEYVQYDATGLAELVRRKQVPALELVDAAIALAERHAPLNSIVARYVDTARALARERLAGPLAGVPFLLKDGVISVRGWRMTHGARAYASRIGTFDSTVVSRFRKAGLILLGLTNASELALTLTTESVLHGPCCNPWNPELTPGGSSGGASAAVAAGIVPAAHGNDGGGSIRVAASCCGLFGLKPTRGRVPAGPVEAEIWQGLGTDGVLTRSVRDSAALLDVMAGSEPGDLFLSPRPTRPYGQEVEVPPGRLRIAFSSKEMSRLGIHPECRVAVQGAANLLAQQGHEVEDAAPPVNWREFGSGFVHVLAALAAANLRDAESVLGRKVGPDDFEPGTRALAARGERTSAGAMEHAWRVLRRASRQLGQFFTRYDLLLTPTLAVPPMPLGKLVPPLDDAEELLRLQRAFSPFTGAWNVTGQPAMSVPLHWTQDGLPVGVQMIARFGGEGLLFRVAAQLERAQPWAHRHPPAFG